MPHPLARLDVHGMLAPEVHECANRAERDFHFWHRIRSRMTHELCEFENERRCWWLWRLEGPSEAVH